MWEHGIYGGSVRKLQKGEHVASVGRTIFAIQAVTKNYEAAASNARPREISWEKPALDSYKLNVDAFFLKNGTCVATADLRNDRGQL